LCQQWEDCIDTLDGKADAVDDKQKFAEELQLSHEMTDEERQQMIDALWEVRAAFSSNYVATGTQNISDIGTTEIEHAIHTWGGPFKVRAKPLPLAQMKDAYEMVADLLEKGCIRKSKSPYSSPIVLVRKKDNSWRLCIDYRALNAQTIPDQTPLPRIDQMLDKASGHEWLTAIDIKAAYHNIKVRECDIEKTAFSCGDQLYEYVRMPFGLSTAAQTFQRAIIESLRDVRPDMCLAYIDDVIIYSDSFEQHIIDVKEVCAALTKFGLKINPQKSLIAQHSLKYLGHYISKAGITADKDKVQSISNYPRPNTKRQMRRFMGLCRYLGRYYRKMSDIMKPLIEMTVETKGLHGRLKWTEERNAMYEKAKEALSSPPVLKPPQVGKTYYIVTDASMYGFGGVLMQEHDNSLCPIYYASKVATPAEQKYAPVEQEARAVIFCLEKFRPYIYLEDVQVLTDHKPLVSMFMKKDASKISPRLYRWMLIAQQYRLTIRYLPGIHNEGADALSRIFETTDDQLTRVQAVRLADDDSPETRLEIVKRFHAGESGGHFSWKKVLRRIRSFYDKTDWPTMTADVRKVVETCDICKQRSNYYEVLPLQPQPPPKRPGQVWHLDFSELRSTATYNAIALGIDAFSRWIIAVPTKHQDAKTAVALMRRIYQHSGRPIRIVTDAGTHFVCKEFQQKLGEWGIDHQVNTPYLKTANGIVERAIGVIQGVISKKCAENNTNLDRWHTMADEAVMAYNVSPHSSLGMLSPYQVERGLTFADIGDEIPKEAELQVFWDNVREKIVETQKKHMKNFRENCTQTNFKIGQPVWIQHIQGMRQRKRKIDLPNRLQGVIVEFRRRSAMVEMLDGKRRAVPLNMMQPRFNEDDDDDKADGQGQPSRTDATDNATTG
jgi:transposase InsO family protein